MLARVLVVLTAGMLLTACIDSQRLRNNLGGPPPSAEPRQAPER
jgi:hypothetical protein